MADKIEVRMGSWEDSLRRQHVSLCFLFAAIFVSAINTHGYTMASVLVWSLNVGLLFLIRHVAKTESPPNHNSWFGVICSMALTVLPMFPPNWVMFILGSIYAVLIIGVRSAARLEKRYAYKRAHP